MVWEILIEALRSSILVSGLVVVMMMLIESMNITSHGDFFSGLRRSRTGQILVSAALGAVPGCMGGFASVSLYTHGIISFGALVAMMIASSGDEAFVMFAMMPDKAWWITLVLLGIAVVVGFIVDAIYHPKKAAAICCEPSYALHDEDIRRGGHNHDGDSSDCGGKKRHFSWRRAVMFLGVVAFIAALLSGLLEEGEEAVEESAGGGINLLSEEWMYWLFGVLSLIVLGVLIFGEDHFVDEHLWRHVVVKHLPSCFGWTFGVLLLLGFGLHFLDIESWISSNTAFMIVLAALVGIIPESGPHLIFVTLYASGIVPLPVLMASCISQDGHASLPLLAESKRSFAIAKAINFAFAVLVGFIAAAIVLCSCGRECLQDKLQSMTEEFPGEVGIACICDGDTVCVNGNDRFPMFSVVKFHQALAVCDRDADSSFDITAGELSPDTWSPMREAHPDGGNFSVRDLLTYTLVESDNNASDILFKRVASPEEVERHIHGLGVTDCGIVWTEEDQHADPGCCEDNWSTPRAAAELIGKFYSERDADERSSFLWSTMAACRTGAARIPKYMPEYATVVHKTGTGGPLPDGGVMGINDVACILLPDGSHFELAVFIKDASCSPAECEELIASIAEACFERLKNS